MATPICKECRHCTDIYYNGLGEVSIYCRIHSGTGISGDPIEYVILQCPDVELPDFNKDCWDENGIFKSEYLHQLRSEIIMGSCYVDDYRNSFGIDPNYVYNFFESYAEWLEYDFLEESDDALKEWYESGDYQITTNNLIQNPNIK